MSILPRGRLKSEKKSISGHVNAAGQMIMGIMIIPALLCLLVLIWSSSRYDHSLRSMETVAALTPMIDNEIAEELWSTISGRKTFEECGVYDTLSIINTTLESQIAQAGEGGALELTVALRTMETLESYVRRIETNMQTGEPIVKSEELLEEVRNVAILAGSMLEDYITQEINAATATTSVLRSIVIACIIVEILVTCLALVLLRRRLRHTTRMIREPIEHLEHFAGLLADGQLQARIPHTDVEDLTNLTDRVNVMADRLGSLIEQNRREQENLKKSELRLLQAQINPHFLYNTLDAIIWQAESGHGSEVVHLTTALSDFFRIALSSGADWIPVSQEIRHVTGYLSIQKTRYRDILNYEIDVDESIGSAYMLKLLLQPLVENALYHGIKNKRGGGVIRVRGERCGQALRFTVTDSGTGMSEAKLAEVRKRLRDSNHPSYIPKETGSGFGLYNVDQRIRLYYGLSEGLCIESGASGTTVSFLVPLKAREDSESDQSISGR